MTYSSPSFQFGERSLIRDILHVLLHGIEAEEMRSILFRLMSSTSEDKFLRGEFIARILHVLSRVTTSHERDVETLLIH